MAKIMVYTLLRNDKIKQHWLSIPELQNLRKAIEEDGEDHISDEALLDLLFFNKPLNTFNFNYVIHKQPTENGIWQIPLL